MERKVQKLAQDQRPSEQKPRFRIVKLERRIAPGNLLHANVHLGGGTNVHLKVK